MLCKGAKYFASSSLNTGALTIDRATSTFLDTLFRFFFFAILSSLFSSSDPPESSELYSILRLREQGVRSPEDVDDRSDSTDRVEDQESERTTLAEECEEKESSNERRLLGSGEEDQESANERLG